MAEKNVKETLEKKKALEAELKALEERLGTAFTQIKDDVEGQVERTRNSVSPAWWVRKYPVYVLGAALFAGFLLAPRGSRSGREQASDTSDVRTDRGASGQRGSYTPGVTDLVTGEVKRLLMRKATNFIIDKIEETIDKNLAPRKKKDSGNQD